MSIFDKAKSLANQAVAAAQEQAGKFSEMNIDVSDLADKAKLSIISGRDTIINQAERVKSYIPGSKPNIIEDIEALHEKMTHGPGARAMDTPTLKAYFELRKEMLNEEKAETDLAILEGDSEEVIDGMIDQIVVLVGTLDLMGVDVGKAWKAVNDANMAKEPGVKPGRPNPFGLQDMIKPDGWVAPSHENNHGRFPEIFKK